MNGNSSKQVLLSVLGIAVLVVAVVGVSFAFFSYTKTGSANNTIETGDIYTYLQTAAAMELSNAMPIPAADEQSTIVSSGNSDMGKFSFTVVGKNDSNTPISYSVYLVPGANPDNKLAANRLANTDIGILVASESSGVTLQSTVTGTGKTVLDAIDGDPGMLIATGTFAAGAAETTHSYDVNLWVRGATVTISDTDANAKYCATATTPTGSATYTTEAGHYGCETGKPVYNTAWYDARVKVVANAPAA